MGRHKAGARPAARPTAAHSSHRPERSRIIPIDDPPELIHRFPQHQQIAVSSQHVAEPRETAGGSSSKSSISWGIINGTRQDGVGVAAAAPGSQPSIDSILMNDRPSKT
eukprot:COSAG01_NODE_245_length_20483_cov_32.975314_19_plen_109_part_00